MQRKVSIIIPLFNSELYIGACIQSVLKQTYGNWEIIMVDDGSTDKSFSIGKDLSLSDERIRFFHQEHKGVSAARNLALDRALGEYVFFLDSDDAIHPCLLEQYIWAAEQNQAQMVMCDFRKLKTKQMGKVLQEAEKCEGKVEWRIGEKNETEEWFHLKYLRQISGIGGKMIARDLVEELRFDEKLYFGEDTLFLYNLIGRQIKIAYAVAEWYYYRMHSANRKYSSDSILNGKCTECCRIIRDSEYQKGEKKFAVCWEAINTALMEQSYIEMKRRREKCNQLKEAAVEEIGHILFRMMYLRRKVMFLMCFYCYPIYIVLRYFLNISWIVSMKIRGINARK